MITKYLKQQFELHRSFEPQDLVKLCFQASFGAEHILTDKSASYKYLIDEYNNIESTNELLYEEISDEIVRVNLGAWKRLDYNIDEFFDIFVKSVVFKEKNIELFYGMIEDTKNFLSLYGYDDLLDSLKEFMDSYLENGIVPVHHSDEYRTYNHPSYRIVKKELLLKYLI